MPRVKSKAQWAKFGAMMKRGEMSKAEFDRRVKGVDYDSLPEHVPARRPKKKGPKVRRKGGRHEPPYIPSGVSP